MAQPKATGRVVRTRNFVAMEHVQAARKLLRVALGAELGDGCDAEEVKQHRQVLQRLGDELDGASNSLWSNEVDLARAAMRGKYNK